MALDRTSEMIAHFIGTFETELDGARLRDLNDSFRHASERASDFDATHSNNLLLRAEHELSGYDPGLTPFTFSPLVASGQAGAVIASRLMAQPVSPISLTPDMRVDAKISVSGASGGGQAYYMLPQPAAISVLAHQSNHMIDNDLIISAEGVEFYALAGFDAQLEILMDVATALAPVPVANPLAVTADAAAFFTALTTEYAALAEDAPEDASVGLHTGEDALGITVNDAAEESAPVLAEVLPVHMQEEQDALAEEAEESEETASSEETEETETTTSTSPEETEETKTTTTTTSPQETEESVTTAVPEETEKAIAAAAPEETVATTASEETEESEPPEAFPEIEGSASAAAEAFEVEDGHAVNAGGNFMINETILAVQHVDAGVIAVMGDAVSIDVMAQINVLYDHNSAPTSTDVGSQVYNAASVGVASTAGLRPVTVASESPALAGLVTRIEADFVNVNWVQQYNFLTDNDRAEITFSGEDSYFALGEDTAFNLANMLEVSQGYDLIIVGGQYINLTMIQQMNVLLDDDFVSYDGDWAAGISTDDNLLLNSASIQTVGVDTFAPLSDDFADAGASLGEGRADIPDNIAQSGWLSGVAQPSVLYIDGDFINVTSIEQTNILSDVDQLYVELEALETREDTPDGPLTITTGSNALINLATVLENGLDSTVMVGGEVYDDLLLYQANLIDTDANPTGVSQVPLATEAVAFLADDMLSDPSPSETLVIAAPDAETSSPDVMQTVLA